MKKVYKIILRVGLSALFVYLTFTTSDLNYAEVSKIIRSATMWYFPIIAALIILNYVVSTYRWKDLLLTDDANKPSYLSFLNLYFIGSFFNNFLVTSIGGDAYKIYKLGKRLEDTPKVFAATFTDRFTGFLMLVIISYFGFLFTWHMWFDFANSFVNNSPLTYLVLVLCLLGFWIATGVFFLFLKVLAKKVSSAQKLLNVLLMYKEHKNKILAALITSLFVQLFAIFSQYFVFASVGYTLPLGFALFVLPVITLAGFFVPSINGIGVQDYMYKELFLLVGVPPAISLSASILYHFLRLLVSLIGGLLYALGKADK